LATPNIPVEAISTLPADWQTSLNSTLAPDESVRFALETDLGPERRFDRGMLVLTDRRWLAWSGDRLIDDIDRTRLRSIEIVEHSSLIEIRVPLTDGSTAAYASTIGRRPDARRFVDQANASLLGTAAADNDRVCRHCGGPLLADGKTCPVCDEAPTPPATRSMLRLLPFVRPLLAYSLLGIALTIISTMAALVWPYLTGRLVDDLRAGDVGVRARIIQSLLGLAGASLVACVLGWARTWVLSWVSERISTNLRMQTYSHLQALSLKYFSSKRTGDLIARVSQDTDRICYFLSVNAIDFACDALAIIITAAILLWIDPVFALITLAPLPVIAWLVQIVRNRLRGGFAAGGRAWGGMTAVLADTIPGIRVVKAFAQEKREVERFREANRRVLDANDRVNKTWALFGPLLVLLTDVGLLVVWAFGAWWVVSGRITVGQLTAFALYLTRFYGRLESMSRMLAAIQRAAASAHRIFEILDMPPDAPLPRRPAHLGRVRGELEFRRIGFSYGNRPVIHELSLSIRPGEMIGLVGHSGSGKTTLVNLACRFYDVTEGAILVDGIDIRDVLVEDYRKNIGLVLQEPFLFYGSIAENIAYGKPNATRREIVDAAIAARAHDFILKLPDGYDSFVGERGQQLSGGERQRISIARALLIDPALLILDEATSAVDTETEREIQLALENLIRGRTTIAIAHRLSTLHKADRIVVLDNGRMIEVGPHQTLLERGGAYARLYQAQLRETPETTDGEASDVGKLDRSA
jgi:ATP-binding cassette, subfamily B, bacterial